MALAQYCDLIAGLHTCEGQQEALGEAIGLLLRVERVREGRLLM